MSVRIRGTDEVVSIRWIPKYTALERFGHWAHAATYIVLAFTGFLIFAPLLKGLVQGDWGQALRLTHRFFAVLFGLMAIGYPIIQPKRFLMNVRENFRFGKEDIGWVKAVIPYYLMGRHVDMPPQPRYNTGERLNACAILLGYVFFGASGLLMWFGKGIIPNWMFRVSVIVHDLTMVATFCMFIVHFFLAVVHPLMWQSLVTMRYGVVPESYAREHHALWYYGRERALKIWEEHRAEAADESAQA
jgi:formate dehydrogenase subunit gamma